VPCFKDNKTTTQVNEKGKNATPLRFTRRYEDTIQERLAIFISFCDKFIGVYMYQKLQN